MAGTPFLSDMSADELPHEALKHRAFICIAIAGLTGIMFGYDMGIVNAAQGPIRDHFGLTDEQLEVFVGLLSWCALPGALLGSVLADRYGRRVGILLAAFVFAIGNVAMALAPSFFVLMTGRAIAGFAMGLTYPIAPMYVAEVSPARLRGGCTALLEVLSNVGILFGYLIGWLCDSNWRAMLAVGLIPPTLLLFGTLFFMIESPRWLASQGRFVEAQDVLNRLLEPLEAQRSFDKITRLDPDKPAGNANLLELFRTPALHSTISVGVGVAFFSQATGCETVVYYTGTILSQAGVTRASMLRATVIIGAVKTATVIASGALVDRLGRRPLLLASASGMAVAMGTLSAAGAGTGGGAALQVAALCLFVMSFSLGFGPIVYTYNAEIYPQRHRAVGLGLAMAICRVMSALISSTFLSLASWLGTSGALALYSGVGVGAAVFVALAVGETNGTTLEEATLNCSGKVPVDDCAPDIVCGA